MNVPEPARMNDIETCMEIIKQGKNFKMNKDLLNGPMIILTWIRSEAISKMRKLTS
jgi:hypothetical protein